MKDEIDIIVFGTSEWGSYELGTCSQKVAVSAGNINLKTSRAKKFDHPQKSSWAFKTFVPRQIQKSLSQNVEKLKANAVPAEFERHFCDSDDGGKITKFTDGLPECLKDYKPPRRSFKMMPVFILGESNHGFELGDLIESIILKPQSKSREFEKSKGVS